MKWRAAPETAMRPWSISASRPAKRLPIQYDGEKPPKAWKVAMFTVSDWSSTVGDRNGHERLVEVEDVEAMRLEHLARLVLEAQARA